MRDPAFDLEDVFRRHRVVWWKNGEGVRRLDHEAGRIGLGYARASAVVAAMGCLDGKLAMNIFSGAGNLLRLCSLQNCRILFGLDRHYEAAASEKWVFDIEHQFDLWEAEVGSRSSYRRPIFLPADILNFNAAPFANSMDAVFVDPPFGRETKSHLEIEESDAKVAFYRSLGVSHEILVPGGRFVAALPTAWRPDVEAEVTAVFGPGADWTTIGDTDSVSLCVTNKA